MNVALKNNAVHKILPFAVRGGGRLDLAWRSEGFYNGGMKR